MRMTINNFVILLSALPISIVGCVVITDNLGDQSFSQTIQSTKTLNPSQSPYPTITLTPSLTLNPEGATRKALFESMMTTQEYWRNTELPSTLEAKGVQCKEGFQIELYMDILRTSNNDWTLFTCSTSPSNGALQWAPGVVDFGTRYTQIIKTDHSITWTIQHQEFDYSHIDRPDALLSPYRWSQDGKKLYLYPQYYPGSSGGIPASARLRYSLRDLYRINLETGIFEILLQRNQYSAVSLSPDDQFLVYSEKDSPNIIHVINMDNGKDRQIEINEEIFAAGAFAWTPDSTKVVFAIGYEKKTGYRLDDISDTTLVVLTIKNMHAQIILYKDSLLVYPKFCRNNEECWLDSNTLYLDSFLRDSLAIMNTVWSINIHTGQVSMVSTPTVEAQPSSTP